MVTRHLWALKSVRVVIVPSFSLGLLYRMKVIHKISFYVALSLTLLLVVSRLATPARNVLSWDVTGYYIYLPATFIYDDLTVQNKQWVDDIIEKYKPSATFYQAVKQPDGRWVMRYTSGLALINAPFFFAAHGYAGLAGYPQDGFSPPYQWGMVIGALFYTLLGLWLCRKLLLRFFDDKLTALLLALLVVGTNYYQITVFAGTIPHNYLFTLYVVLLLNTIKWYENPTFTSAFLIGLMTGLIALIRPNELVVIFIPLLWGITGFNKTIIEKLQLVFKKFGHVIVLGIGVFLGGCVQLIYWKYATGHWLYYSYQDPGVGFDLKSPHTVDFLFSYRKGWFVYTPIMLLAVLGFISLFKQNRKLFWGFTAYFIINLYIASSWSVWWYAGGSYSSRSMVSSYGLMLLPLGYLLQSLTQTKRLKMVTYTLLGAMVALNVFQTWQFKVKILDGERITKAYYWRVFGKTSVTDEDKKLLLVERSTETIEVMPATVDFSKKVLAHYSFDTAKENYTRHWDTMGYNGRGSLRMGEEMEFSPGIDIKYKDITQKEYAWLRVSVRIFVPQNSEGGFPLLAMAFHHKDAAYKYRSSEFLNPQLKKGEWNLVTLEYQTPEARSIEDNLKVYVWNRDRKTVYIDDLIVECFEPRN